MPIGYTYSNPYGYKSSQTVQSPTWSDYLAQYNQRAKTQQGMANHALAPAPGGFLDKGSYGEGQSMGVQGNAQAQEARGRTFQSDPNNTYTEQASKDWLQDFKSPQYQLTAAAVPGWNNVRAVQSYQSYGRSRDAQANYQALVRAQQESAQKEGQKDWAYSLDPRIRVEMERRMGQGGSMADPEIQQMYRQLKTSDLQGELTNQVQEHYKDPLRQTKLEEQIGAEKQNSLGQLADQYKMIRTKQAQNAAGHGMLGSSVDISQRGQMGRARDSAAVSVENQAQQERSQFAQNDQEQQRQLMQMVYGTDPFQAGSTQNTLSYLQQMQQDRGDLNASQNQMYDINQFANSLYSQAIGGGLNAAAQNINAYGPGAYQYYQSMQGAH